MTWINGTWRWWTVTYPFMEMQVRYYVLSFCTAVGLNAFAARQQGREWHFSDQPAASAYVSNRG